MSKTPDKLTLKDKLRADAAARRELNKHKDLRTKVKPNGKKYDRNKAKREPQE